MIGNSSGLILPLCKINYEVQTFIHLFPGIKRFSKPPDNLKTSGIAILPAFQPEIDYSNPSRPKIQILIDESTLSSRESTAGGDMLLTLLTIQECSSLILSQLKGKLVITNRTLSYWHID